MSHQALANKKTAKPILESQYYIVFKNNWAHASKLLMTYGGLTQSKLDLLHSQNTRSYFICKTAPMYCVTNSSILLLN